MSSLDSYKKTSIAQLTTIFNSQVNTLKKQLNININNIYKLKINNKIKLNYINNFLANYNNAINNLKIKLNADIRAINSLSKIPGTPNKSALLIGINYKGAQYELNGCINDTNNIKNLLEQKYGFNQFTFLTDDTNKKPTKENIITELTNLLVNANSGDTLFLLYSGHGTCVIDLNGDEDDGQDEIIMPIDATSLQSCILDDELSQIIKTNLKPDVKLFALFDCCFSGTVLDLKYTFSDSNVTTNPRVSETNGQVIMISGCLDTQTSADTYVNFNGKNMASGAMTFSFLKTIEDLGTKIPIKTLFSSMRSLLKDNGYEQIPQLSSGKLIDINTMVVPL
jgi:hypothetical protein